MKKIPVALSALALCLLTGCFDFCYSKELKQNTTYQWSYSSSDGSSTSGEFTTNEYGQATFDVPSNVDCTRVTLTEKGDQKDEMLDGPAV